MVIARSSWWFTWRHNRFRGALAERQSTASLRASSWKTRKRCSRIRCALGPDGTTLLFTTVGAVAINPLCAAVCRTIRKDFAALACSAQLDDAGRERIDAGTRRELADMARHKPAISIGVTGLGAISISRSSSTRAGEISGRAIAAHRKERLTYSAGGSTASSRADNHRSAAGADLGSGVAGWSESFPDVPTLVEQGFADAVANQWAGILAPALTPLAEITKLNGALNAALADPEIRSKLQHAGVTPSPSSAAEFATYLQNEITRWGNVIREKGIKGE